MPESVTWLVAKGDVEKAEGILQKAAKFDKDKYAPDYFLVKPSTKEQANTTNDTSETIELDNVKQRGADVKMDKPDTTSAATPASQYTLLSIRKSRKLCLYTASMCLLW